MSACQIPNPQPTPFAAPAITATRPVTARPVTATALAPTARPSRTPAATETLRPEPTVAPLMGAGPYLLITQSDSSGTYLLAFDPDGVGRQRIDLPDGYELRHSLVESLSLQGRYLALYRGSAGVAGDVNDLSLGVLDLRTGQLAVEVPLLTADYPADLQDLFERQDPGAALLAEAFERFRQQFADGLEALAWSPNGRYLAFAGQIDGPSSDAYVIDVETLQRRRLTDGDEQIVYLQWSSDGRRLLNTSTNAVAVEPVNHLYAIDLQTDTNVALTTEPTGIGFWLDPEHVWMDYAANGDFSSRGARVVNAATGAALDVWPGSFDLVSLNWPERKASLMGCPQYDVVADACGEFVVDLTTGVATRVGPVDRDKLWFNQEGDPTAPRRLRDWHGNTLLLAAERVELITVAGTRRDVPADPDVWADLQDFALAPDGRHLFAQLFNRLEIVDLESGALRVVDPALGDALHGLVPYENLAWATVVPAP